MGRRKYSNSSAIVLTQRLIDNKFNRPWLSLSYQIQVVFHWHFFSIKRANYSNDFWIIAARLQCNAIWRTTMARLRSETIFASWKWTSQIVPFKCRSFEPFESLPIGLRSCRKTIVQRNRHSFCWLGKPFVKTTSTFTQCFYWRVARLTEWKQIIELLP